MDESQKVPPAPADAAQESEGTVPEGRAEDEKPAVSERDHAVGHAMRALFESGDVSVVRGDQTRVMTRADRESNAPQEPGSAASPSSAPVPAQSHSSGPPAPRVDAVLWLVLVSGVFAIAGWMIVYAL